MASKAAAERVEFRAGFACLVGRPNAGKSTLTNALVGTKVAITSDKPQTTRHTIRGIVHREDAQLILVDTPGLHRPRTLLGQRLNDLVHATLAEVDVIGFCSPSDEKVGPGERFICAELDKIKPGIPIVALVTKIDAAPRQMVADHLLSVQKLGDEMLGRHGGFAEIVPCSALTSAQVDDVADVLVSHLPESPPLYLDGELTDEPEMIMVAELVREVVLGRVREELPHSVAVVVEEMVPGDPDFGTKADAEPQLQVRIIIYVERDSQKGIVIGTRGAGLKAIRTQARPRIAALLGVPVYLDLHVKVAREWQRDAKQLRKLGF